MQYRRYCTRYIVFVNTVSTTLKSYPLFSSLSNIVSLLFPLTLTLTFFTLHPSHPFSRSFFPSFLTILFYLSLRIHLSTFNLSLSFYRHTFPQSLSPSHNVLELTYSLYSIPATLSLTFLFLSLSFLFLCSPSFPLPVFTLFQCIHISYLQFSSLFLFSI